MAVKFKIEVPPGDASEVSIEFLPPSTVSGRVELNQEQLLGFVQSLGKAHSYMVAGHKAPSLEGVQIEAVFDARWYVQPEMLNEATSMSFYHPSFGPLGFLIPMDQIERMIGFLTRQIELHRASRGETAN